MEFSHFRPLKKCNVKLRGKTRSMAASLYCLNGQGTGTIPHLVESHQHATLLGLQQRDTQMHEPHASMAGIWSHAGAKPGLTMQDLMRLALASGSNSLATSPMHTSTLLGHLPGQQTASNPLFGAPGLDHFVAARHPTTVSSMLSVAAQRQGPVPMMTMHLAASHGPAYTPTTASSDSPRSSSDGEDSENEKKTARGSVNTIFPRRKQGQHTRTNSQPVVLNEATLSQLFTLPLHKAAMNLGISATAMKSACRKLGIKKWPYRSLNVTTTKSQRTHNCSPPETPPRRGAPRSSSYASSDLSRDALLLAETLRLLHQGVRKRSYPHDDYSRCANNSESSDSEYGSELSGASTRDEASARGPSPVPSPGPTFAPANSVASLLN